MRNFDADNTAALVAETAKTFFFVDLELDSGTIYYTDADIPLHDPDDSDIRYEPNQFQLGNLKFGAGMSVDRARIELQNIDLVMAATLLNETVTNRTCKIKFGCLNSGHQIIALETLFSGFITSWGGMTERSCPLVLGNWFLFWSKKTLRLAQATCPWIFGGTECGYSGGASRCNKTWARCRGLSNTDSFGGFRFLPALLNAKIWWGMTPGAKVPTK
jgi:hypothetical protein